MDYANLFSKIIAQTVALMQDLLKKYRSDVEAKIDIEDDKENIIHMLKVAQDFTAILDNKKAANYKLAILVEFLENILSIIQVSAANNYEALVSDIHALFDYIDEIKAKGSEQEALVNTCAARLDTFYDFDAIQPQVVTFWMNSISTIESLHKMQVFMLFLPKSMHENILKMDKKLKTDATVQILIEFLNE